jgi:hypothetical protein
MKALKLITALVIGIIHTQFIYCQTPYSIKEQYDMIDVESPLMDAGYLDATVPYYTDQGTGLSARLGDRASYIMTSYMRMYKTTKDKAYLIKFINLCLKVQSLKMENNQSNNPPGDAPIWANEASMYHNGLILAPMAEFIHLVKIDDPGLQTLEFPVNLINNANLSTYLDFAGWLKSLVAATLNYMIDYYWIDDSRAFAKGLVDHDDLDKETANEINQQSAFGVAMFYLGHAYPNEFLTGSHYYLHKADAMAQLYQTTINLDDDCACVSYLSKIFHLPSTNAYWWYDYGWRVTYYGCGLADCEPYIGHSNQPKCDEYQEYLEDISHGILTLFFPRVVYEYSFSSSITLDDMTYWRNTFAKNIYDGSGNFRNNVMGTNDQQYLGHNLNDLRWRVLGWMPFYKYDDYDSSPIPLYDIVMNYYANGVPGDQYSSTLNYPVVNLQDGLDYLGLSEVVSAQWDKECINLTLYNRDVVYDQDFVVNGNLTVAPRQNTNDVNYTTTPFADPQTFIDSGPLDRFIVESGITVNMTAGNSIELLPGFEAKAGSNFMASIDPLLCPSGIPKPSAINQKRYASYSAYLTDNQEADSTISRKTENAPASENSLTLTPNPFSSYTNLQFSVKKKCVVDVRIIDFFGKVIYHEINNRNFSEGFYTFKIPGQIFQTGEYYCILSIDSKTAFTKKVFKY